MWDFDYEGGSNIIDVYIRYLRKKIDEDFSPKLIHTVRGVGYILKEWYDEKTRDQAQNHACIYTRDDALRRIYLYHDTAFRQSFPDRYE